MATSGSSALASYNLDSLLSIYVPTQTKVQNWKLGVVSHCTNFIFFCYVFIYKVIWMKGYLAIDPQVVGFVSTSLADPLVDDLPTAELAPDYCDYSVGSGGAGAGVSHP